jgi:hypothetical protein
VQRTIGLLAESASPCTEHEGRFPEEEPSALSDDKVQAITRVAAL